MVVGGGCWCSPESRVVQRRVPVFILDLDGAVGLQQGLHNLHVALVGGDLKRSLALVLDVHLPGAQTQLQVHKRQRRPGHHHSPTHNGRK